MAILNNHRDLVLLFHDRNGNEIKTLEPRIGIRSIPFTKKLNAYRIGTTNRQGWISVLYQGHTSYFDIKRQYNNTLPARTKRRVLGTFPINHILSPIFYIGRTVKSFFNYPHISPPGIYYRVRKLFAQKNYNGYVVLNKPKFKPGDTVKLKAYIVKKNGKPIHNTLQVEISGYRGNYWEKKLGEITSYRPGAYVYEFVLDDSLKLELDRRYSIHLIDKRQNDNYPSVSFEYEQYELKQNFFSIRSSDSPPHKPATIFLKGTDANDLPLYDVSAEVLVMSKNVNAFERPSIFVKDTLWIHSMKLDPLGETSIALPDSIFPKAEIDYEVTAIFTNADNERHVKNLNLKYTYKIPVADTEIKNDSVIFTSTSQEKFQVQSLNASGDIYDRADVLLPYAQKIDPYTTAYLLLQNKVVLKRVDLDATDAGVNVAAQRTKDSLLVVVQNSRKLAFRYQLFRGNTIIDQGQTTEYTLKRKASPNARYYFSIQYIWAGKSNDQNFDLPFAKKPLVVDIDHPSSVFPGQRVDVKIQVKDAFNKPVPHADLTAYAITKKFRETSPIALPDFERFKSRKIFNEFHEKDINTSLSNHLDYDFWKNKLGLDSIEYYNFLYPANGLYTNHSLAKDSITQVAPFIVGYGNIRSVYYIYVDNELKYYHGTESIEPYSFRARAGLHTITIRLRDRLLKIKNVTLKKGFKLTLSIDLYNLPVTVEEIKMDPVFSANEINNLAPHFLLLNRDNAQRLAYLQQGDDIHTMPFLQWGNDQNKLVGPFSWGPASYHTPDFTTSFSFKPDRAITFMPGLIDQERISISDRFKQRLHFFSFNPSLKDQVQTEKRVLEFWKRQVVEKVYTVKKYPDNHPVVKNTGTLVVLDSKPVGLPPRFATFIINLDVPDEYYIFPGHEAYFTPLLPGTYQVVVLYQDESYLKPAPVKVNAYGRTFYRLDHEKIHIPDSFSRQVMERVKKWSNESVYIEQTRQRQMQDLRELYYRESTDNTPLTGGRWVTGRVTDESGEATPGVNVILKGTTNGTATDMQGEYRIYVPANGVLVFSFIGYTSQEINTRSQDALDIQLNADVQQLSEVVVIGYGSQEKKMLTGSVSALQGRMAGVSILSGNKALVADSVSIKLRGASALASGNAPLVLIDGVLRTLDDIDKNRITSIEVLKSEQAVALYGSQAANGIILISTKPGTTRAQLLKTKLPEAPQLLTAGDAAPGSSLRKNFRDYAFWQPKLYTDQNGEATFQTTFPDDITGWDIQVLAMASKKRTGQTSSKVQSYKPLAAQLSLPNFLLQGDTAQAMGKITNYAGDSLQITRSITVSGKPQLESSLVIKNSVIDTINLFGPAHDSLAVKYGIAYKKYEDGELRNIPVMPVGSLESTGFFAALPRDTTAIFNFNTPGNIKFYAQTDLLDVLLDEVNILKVYPYDCNEQLASKLKALLAEKSICIYRKEKFKYDNQVEKAIKKLIANQHKDGSWGWWNMRGGSHWITLHVAKTLLWATSLGYKARFDQQGVKNYLMEYTTSSTPIEEQLRSWIFLSESGETIAVQPIIDSLKKKNAIKSLHQNLLIQRLRQLQKYSVDWSVIEKYRHETLKGNWYWGETNYTLMNNDVDNTLLVFQLMEARNQNDPDLLKLQNYFLEKRKRCWTNTYESARIIETLLPRLLKQKHVDQKPVLVLNGNQTITSFPVEIELRDYKTISIAKTGSAPIYITAYQQHWNLQPKKVEKEFIIHTALEDNVKKLKAGKPVTLHVTLEVKKDAEYVMINIPIPAGCSYNTKDQSWTNGEVHREYDLHETRIYCERLRAGIYQYAVKLLPRYKGKYQLNPAKAEWMYFPVVYGREEMKSIAID